MGGDLLGDDFMAKFIPILLFALGTAGVATAAPAATPRNYDCAKPGNASKAVCKGSAATFAKLDAKVAKATAKVQTKVVKTTVNAQARVAARPMPAKVTTASVIRNYDCTKAGNNTKAQCRGSVIKTATVARPATAPRRVAVARPMARPAVRPAVRTAAASANADNRVAAGAIAQCKDGLFSHAAHRDGACARHGGVAHWS